MDAETRRQLTAHFTMCPEFSEWVDHLSDVARMDRNNLIEHALVKYADSIGVSPPAVRRRTTKAGRPRKPPRE